jgi:3-phenylpropionate/trans-cinnamate dioxygenase ferredoxin reductase component
MYSYQYLVIGGGMTAASAIKGIREIDPKGSIGLVGAEADPPYKRPPLSKNLWKGKPLDSIWMPLDAQKAELHIGQRINWLDPASMTAQDEQGNDYHAEKILLATGAMPRRLPFGGDDIIYFRSLASYRRLTRQSDKGQDLVVVGGGFIGAEIAAALAMNGRKVTMVFPESGVGALVYPADLSSFIGDYYRGKGVTILPGEKPVNIEKTDRGTLIKMQSGREIRADAVVAGIGVQPDTELAASAGIATGNGIIVDEYLRTNRPGIYSAGDVAEFFNPALGKRIRVEHEDNALQMGRTAGRNMAGTAEPYHHLPYFYSDLFELGYEAIGELDARHAIVSDWEEPYRKGVVYYVRDNRVTGILLWNVWDKIPLARDLIKRFNPALNKDPADLSQPGWMIPYRSSGQV